jgi:DNA segregation ATPase FtsK/SpoIIIE, S-DNA-T family
MGGGPVGRLATAYGRAVAAHREALAALDAARRARPSEPAEPTALRETVERLRAAGEALQSRPVWTESGPVPFRVGDVHVAGGVFPALVPLAHGAHLAVDADARDPRVAALLRTLLVRLLAAAPPGRLRARVIDRAALGAAFGPLRPLVDAGVVAEPATTDGEIRELVADAERHVRAAHAGIAASGVPAGRDLLLVVAASTPDPPDLARLAALTHAGPAASACLVLAGYRPDGYGVALPPLGSTVHMRLDGDRAWVDGFPAPVLLDGDLPAEAVRRLAAHLGEQARRDAALSFVDILPPARWRHSSAEGLRTAVGRAERSVGRAERSPAATGHVELAFDDATPHWLVGGRTGSGKTVFLLNVLYGLATRYSPRELVLYLLDFKEGVSFTEFVPTDRDPSWIPHARAVGIESDREYGVAVLRELRGEMARRATVLKRHGATKLSDLRRDLTQRPVPRVVAVIDEFHVLFAGNDTLAREAVALLEELARKGRSYGIHLVLASQSVSGIEALYGRVESIFGQFPLRVALAGGSGVLGPLNDAAGGLPVGTAIVNAAAGVPGANTTVRFPDAYADAGRVAALRRDLWRARLPGARPPSVFRGYESARVEDDPTFRELAPGDDRRHALVGRRVDVELTTAGFVLDATPGRHLAVVGTSPVGAAVLHAAATGLARQHAPGTARFLLAPLVAVGDGTARETERALTNAGHPVERLDATGLAAALRTLAEPGPAPPTYLVVFGADAASATLATSDEAFRTGLDDLRAVLRDGPAYGIHLLGWWRGLRRLADDIGGSSNRDDVACLVALNVLGSELDAYLGMFDLAYAPRPNRALLVDRHEQRVELIVPFAGHSADAEVA